MPTYRELLYEIISKILFTSCCHAEAKVPNETRYVLKTFSSFYARRKYKTIISKILFTTCCHAEAKVPNETRYVLKTPSSFYARRKNETRCFKRLLKAITFSLRLFMDMSCNDQADVSRHMTSLYCL